MARSSDHVDGARLWRRLMELSAFGARPDGGVDRQTLIETEIAARAYLVALGRALGLEPYTDATANLFLPCPGRRPDLSLSWPAHTSIPSRRAAASTEHSR
ncbi:MULTISPECIES: hypothetical protein [Methylobacterium]|uniref:Amidase n=2 Tax=Methylobacterium TaxID=407 RepID=A0A0C6FP57_9HYPH|nr:hypothetical protein [Methylobacterium aquaticum]BAQ50118.1 amidase [Methylobacterium aquaticum]